jgi:hypothetical protein
MSDRGCGGAAAPRARAGVLRREAATAAATLGRAVLPPHRRHPARSLRYKHVAAVSHYAAAVNGRGWRRRSSATSAQQAAALTVIHEAPSTPPRRKQRPAAADALPAAEAGVAGGPAGVSHKGRLPLHPPSAVDRATGSVADQGGGGDARLRSYTGSSPSRSST